MEEEPRLSTAFGKGPGATVFLKPALCLKDRSLHKYVTDLRSTEGYLGYRPGAARMCLLPMLS